MNSDLVNGKRSEIPSILKRGPLRAYYCAESQEKLGLFDDINHKQESL